MNPKAPAKKKDDAAFDVEQQFILRLPPVWLLLPVKSFNTNRIYCIIICDAAAYLVKFISVGVIIVSNYVIMFLDSPLHFTH